MSSNLAIVEDAAEIMQSLPPELRMDSHMQECVIEGLQAGLMKVEVQAIANKAAIERLEQVVSQGFSLVNNEIQGIKHSAELDRVHANYAKQAAEKAQSIAEQAWLKTQEVAIGVAKAEAKADGARDLARQPRGLGIDPFWGMGMGALLVFGTLIFFTRVEKVEDYKPRPQSQSAPIYSCDGTTVNVAGTTDFGKCKKLSGEV